MTMHGSWHVLLRHAWAFGVGPYRDLFFLAPVLCGRSFADSRPRNGTAPLHCCHQQSAYHVPLNADHVLEWPANILKTLVCQCHLQAIYIREGAVQ